MLTIAAAYTNHLIRAALRGLRLMAYEVLPVQV